MWKNSLTVNHCFVGYPIRCTLGVSPSHKPWILKLDKIPPKKTGRQGDTAWHHDNLWTVQVTISHSQWSACWDITWGSKWGFSWFLLNGWSPWSLIGFLCWYLSLYDPMMLSPSLSLLLLVYILYTVSQISGQHPTHPWLISWIFWTTNMQAPDSFKGLKRSHCTTSPGPIPVASCHQRSSPTRHQWALWREKRINEEDHVPQLHTKSWNWTTPLKNNGWKTIRLPFEMTPLLVFGGVMIQKRWSYFTQGNWVWSIII